jgi:hypothetical protein
MTLLVLTTLVDALAVGCLLWLLRRGDREVARLAGALEARLGGFRAATATTIERAEARLRALEAVLAEREATLRVLLAAHPGGLPAGPQGDGAIVADPAEIRLVRDLEVVLGAGADLVEGRP